MENRPINSLNSRSPASGVDPEDYERYLKWANEVWIPLQLNVGGMLQACSYRIIKDDPQYGFRLNNGHFPSLDVQRSYLNNPENQNIGADITTWTDRGIMDPVWSSSYVLLRSFRSKPVFNKNNQDTRIENAPVMHLEGYRMDQDEQDKYLRWLNEFGFQVFMPLFIKLPGLAGYDFFQNTGYQGRETKGWEYPQYLSIVYFENIESFESFKQSPEMAGFLKSIRSVIPRRLGYVWYVQYQLEKIFRK